MPLTQESVLAIIFEALVADPLASIRRENTPWLNFLGLAQASAQEV